MISEQLYELTDEISNQMETIKTIRKRIETQPYSAEKKEGYWDIINALRAIKNLLDGSRLC